MGPFYAVITVFSDILEFVGIKMDNLKQYIEYRITTKCCICGTLLDGLVFDRNNSYSPYEEAIASLQVKQACSKKACVIECERKYYPENFEKLLKVCKSNGGWGREDELWARLIGAHAISDVPFNPKYKPCPQPSFGNEHGDRGTPIIDTEKCDICGTAITHIGKRHTYLQYNEWQHSVGQSFQRCFKKHFGYDLDKERFEESSKIFFMKQLKRIGSGNEGQM